MFNRVRPTYWFAPQPTVIREVVEQPVAPTPTTTNYAPWIIGGVVLIIIIVLITRS